MSSEVSTVVPTYRPALVLEKAAQGVIVQTCQSGEIISMDDGSDDDA